MSEILLVNPRKRRTRRKTTSRKRRSNPVRRRRVARRSPARRVTRRRRRRSNPSMRGIQGQAMTAFNGAVGALGLDIALGYIPIPANLKAGPLGYATKLVGAVGLGMVAKNFVRASTATKLTEGAMTVVIHGALRDAVQQFAPQIQMGEYLYPNESLGYYGSGWNPNYSADELGAYLPSLDTDSFDMNQEMGAYVGDDWDY